MTTFANIALKRVPLDNRLIRYVRDCCAALDGGPSDSKYFEIVLEARSVSTYFAAVRMRGLNRVFDAAALDLDPYHAAYGAFQMLRDRVDQARIPAKHPPIRNKPPHTSWSTRD